MSTLRSFKDGSLGSGPNMQAIRDGSLGRLNMQSFKDGSLGSLNMQAYQNGSLGNLDMQAFRDGSLGGCGCGVGQTEGGPDFKGIAAFVGILGLAFFFLAKGSPR